jgi:hypothetical protein
LSQSRDLIITLVIQHSDGIQKSGTLTVTRGQIAHIQAFKTTNSSDTAYAIDQALRRLTELEHKQPAKTARPKPNNLRLDTPPAEADTDTTSEEPADIDAGHHPSEPETAEVINYQLISISGEDKSPIAFKHAARLAQALHANQLWDNTTALAFDQPVDTWNQYQTGQLDLKDIADLYTTLQTSSVRVNASTDKDTTNTAQTNLL